MGAELHDVCNVLDREQQQQQKGGCCDQQHAKGGIEYFLLFLSLREPKIGGFHPIRKNNIKESRCGK